MAQHQRSTTVPVLAYISDRLHEATMNGVMIGNGTVITTAGIMITTAGIIAKPGHVARATPCRMASANHTVDIRAH